MREILDGSPQTLHRCFGIERCDDCYTPMDEGGLEFFLLRKGDGQVRPRWSTFLELRRRKRLFIFDLLCFGSLGLQLLI